MKFYVASKFENTARVREVIQELTQMGYYNTYDWTYSDGRNKNQAYLDLNGVLAADFLVGIFEEEYHYKGALVEMGVAIAQGIPIFILGDFIDRMIFMELDSIQKIKSLKDIRF